MNALLFKSILIYLFLIIVCADGISQKADREIGVSMYGLGGDFNLIYKKKLANDFYRRINIGLANISFSTNDNQSASNFLVAFGAGKERRKPISKKLEFIYGLQESISLGFNRTKNATDFSITPALSYLAGVKYDLNENLYLTLEMFPEISAFIGLGDTRYFLIKAGLDINAIDAGIVYRFHKD